MGSRTLGQFDSSLIVWEWETDKTIHTSDCGTADSVQRDSRTVDSKTAVKRKVAGQQDSKIAEQRGSENQQDRATGKRHSVTAESGRTATQRKNGKA